MNGGMKDASNLAWKLAAVLRGLAPEAILDTYEVERAPRASRMPRSRADIMVAGSTPTPRARH